MGNKAKVDNNTANGFVGSVFKFSISTYINFIIYGISLLAINFLVKNPANLADINMFINLISLVMSVGIIGLDQSLIRFFYKPPGDITSNSLFRVCLYISAAVLVVLGLLGTVFGGKGLVRLLKLDNIGEVAIPLVFLAAFFYMVSRYFNVLYRMEQDIKLYTVQSILMNFFLKMFYLLGAFFKNQVFAMMICSVVGLGAFALVFALWRKDTLRPRRGEMKKEVLKPVLLYGTALAPTMVMLHFNSVVSQGLVGNFVSKDAQGLYGFGVTLSNIVTTIQGGFSSFWGAYMFENYKTQQERIKKVHDFLNFVILVFFALLVAFEDVMFLILRNYKEVQQIFPLMMLGAVFTILCETTVYGNAIARRPIFDTLGFALAFATNVLLGLWLMPLIGIVGGAVALAGSNFIMYLFRTIFGQKFYRTIRWPLKTAAALLIAVLLATAGTVFANAFVIKLLCSLAAIAIYCIMYKTELLRCWKLGVSILKSLFKPAKA